jgi:GT2 family glycosyltransferase
MSITAILTLYKRPHTLIQQLESVQNQSIPPENIIIWKNYAEGVTVPEIPEHLKKNLSIIESSKNFGVWARFTCGLLVNSKYICVFDDDTIPGKDWFKNCVETMQTHCGLLGTIGLRFEKGDRYSHEPRIGWDGPNDTPQQVDIVGHAWFFQQDWLHYLWECCPDYNSMFIVGEDIGFSYILQKHGINTYVPPHPLNNTELWGSQRELAFRYGQENVGISMQGGAYEKFHSALKYYIDKGFITMNNR